tara:strand:+ start:917 stop:1162 length:246 start_codon:yes stop_codon:yes gene_type:complete
MKTKDWFTDECNSCGDSLSEDGMVYVIQSSYAICQKCYENIKVYLVNIEIEEIEIDDDNKCPACSRELLEGSCMSCGETYE